MFRRISLFALALVLALSCTAFAEEEERDILEVHFLNVGRNDGILIICGGEVAFIDGGSYSWGTKCAEYIQSRGVTELKYYIGTHAHTDHVAGAPAIMGKLKSGAILTNYDLAVSAMRDNAHTKQERDIINSTPYVKVKKGDEFMLGGAVLTCVGPDKIVRCDKYTEAAENNNSLIFRLTFFQKSFLFCSDTTNMILKDLVKQDSELLCCDVLKSPHHNVGLHDTLYSVLKCKYFIFSTSSDYPPKYEQINKARRAGARVMITSYTNAGTIIFKTDGEEMTYETQYKLDSRWKLNISKVTLKAGKHKSYTKQMHPTRMLETLFYESSDPAVAYPDPASGTVYAVAPGECVIRATAFDGSYRDIKVTVLPAK